MLTLARSWITVSITIWASSTEGVSLDELSTSQQMKAILERSFPLHSSAISWEDVPWRSYEKIIVSGPQRSGTTFFAAALAKHLGYVHADEFSRYNLKSRFDPQALIRLNGSSPFESILDIKANVVLQRPTWSHSVHTLLDHIREVQRPLASKVFVAFLARNCLDVFRSQNRIMQLKNSDGGWTCEFGRTVEWKHYHNAPDLLAAIEDEHDMICTIKQQAYRNYQRSVMDKKGIANAPIAFDSFHSLPQFVPSANRSTLAPKELAGGLSAKKPK